MYRWEYSTWTCTFLLSCCFYFTNSFKPQGSCMFPEKWQGTWFQSGIRQPVLIQGTRLSSKGRCLGNEGDKFLLVDEKRACYRCVVIHEKHANVLQYKETYCYGRDSLSILCSYITGDALLYSMFREDATAVSCPFKGPLTFTYNRGHGECRSPVSSIESCTEDSKLLLSYQACPDVHGSESAVEELQCLAMWKEGSARYLVGRVHHNHVTSNEDRYRCFVYERASSMINSAGILAQPLLDGSEYRVAQSGDATCNGLFSATEGSRTMTLRRATTWNKCRFPSWAASFSHWHTLDYSATYSFHHRNSSLRITNTSASLDMKVVCSQIKYSSRSEDHFILLAHYTKGCQNGFMCMSLTRRDLHVIEIQNGAPSKRQEDACLSPFFNRTVLPFVTLVTTTPQTRPCPYMGKFEINNLMKASTLSNTNYKQTVENHYFERNFFIDKLRRSVLPKESNDMVHRIKRLDQDQEMCDFNTLVIGCSSMDTMEFKTEECETPDLTKAYSCHGKWDENGTSYLITTPLSRSSHGARRFCFIYKEMGPDLVLFSTSAGSCSRILQPGVTGELTFNVTNIGKCMQLGRSSKSHPISSLLLILSITFTIQNIIKNINR